MEGESGGEARKGRVRWRLLIAILVAGGTLLGVLQAPDLFPDDAHRNLATIAAGLLVTGLLVLWAIFGTGRSLTFSLSSLLASVAAVAALIGCVRVDGFSGNLWPRFAWRWAERPDESLAGSSPTRRPGESSGEHAGVADLSATSAHDFAQFLGPKRDATIEAPRFDVAWNIHPPRLVWEKPVGAGWSAFAVVGDYAVTQEQRGEKECVTCYALATGDLLWTHGDKGRFSKTLAGDGPRSTPTVDEGRVYTLGAFGRLNCLDGRTGELLWTHDVVEENDASLKEWGESCSPLVVDGFVVVSAGGKDGRSVVAYDKETGELAWHAGDQRSSYASPRLAEVAGVRQILMVNQESVSAHAPEDGHILWEFRWLGNTPKVPDAVAIDANHVFISAGYGLGCQLLEIGSSDGDKLAPTSLWQSKLLKPKFTNVVVRDGHVYGLDDGRALVCLDLKDGKRRWRGGRYGHGQLLLVNDMLLVQAETGEVALVEASSERLNELTRFAPLDGQTWNNPVVAGRLLLVRNATQAACYELPPAE
ncbi:MAG TPA: PQQ-binding-like beta-propeller repeat protein [Pirellulales bacterium]|jgi:outer membrane protein assembly factor BamB|nr:PQQ-binding-like beta-propeller repeat protein [Pirellulales bacterium]